MSESPTCPHCGNTETTSGPRPGILRCAGCRQLLITMADGQRRLWFDWTKSGRANRAARSRAGPT